MKTKKDLKSTYLTVGSWSSKIVAAVNYFREPFKDRVSSERESGQFKLDEM